MLTLNIQKRDTAKALKALRTTGVIPAVYYGPKEDSHPISVNEIEFLKVWKAAGESTVINLTGDGHDHEALIHEVSLHPVSSKPIHIDFYVIEKGKALQVAVPLEFVGESEAVKSMNGTLVKVLHEVEIEALPKDLPKQIEVDISPLTTLESQILAKDLKLPSGVTLMIKPDDVVASVAAQVVEPEETTPVDISQIEISEERGKKEEEGGEAADAGKEAAK